MTAVRVDTQNPRPVYPPPVESGRSRVKCNIDFAEWLGQQGGQLQDVERVFDGTALNVTAPTLTTQSASMYLEQFDIGTEDSERLTTVTLRGKTTDNETTPPIDVIVRIRPDKGDPAT